MEKREIIYRQDLLAFQEKDYDGSEQVCACQRCPWGPPCPLMGSTSEKVIVMESAEWNDNGFGHTGGETTIFRCDIRDGFQWFFPEYAAMVTDYYSYTDALQLLQFGQVKELPPGYRPGTGVSNANPSETLRVDHFELSLPDTWSHVHPDRLDQLDKVEIIGLLDSTGYRNFDGFAAGRLDEYKASFDDCNTETLIHRSKRILNESYSSESSMMTHLWKLSVATGSSKAEGWAHEVVYAYLTIRRNLLMLNHVNGLLSDFGNRLPFPIPEQLGPVSLTPVSTLGHHKKGILGALMFWK